MARKTAILTIMLMTYLGQITVTSVIPCHMVLNMKEDIPMMDHSAHDMSNPSGMPLTDISENCCSKAGNCSMSGCLSIALPVQLEEMKESFTSEKATHFAFLTLSQVSNSPYRPPIFA